MNNLIVTAIAAAVLAFLDSVHASPWVAAPIAPMIGFFVARHLTRRGHE